MAVKNNIVGKITFRLFFSSW